MRGSQVNASDCRRTSTHRQGQLLVLWVVSCEVRELVARQPDLAQRAGAPPRIVAVLDERRDPRAHCGTPAAAVNSSSRKPTSTGELVTRTRSPGSTCGGCGELGASLVSVSSFHDGADGAECVAGRKSATATTMAAPHATAATAHALLCLGGSSVSRIPTLFRPWAMEKLPAESCSLRFPMMGFDDVPRWRCIDAVRLRRGRCERQPPIAARRHRVRAQRRTRRRRDAASRH